MNTCIRINCETLSLVFMSEKLSLGKRALFFFLKPLPAESTRLAPGNSTQAVQAPHTAHLAGRCLGSSGWPMPRLSRGGA